MIHWLLLSLGSVAQAALKVRSLSQLPVIINAVSPGERILYLETESSKVNQGPKLWSWKQNWLLGPIYSSSGISNIACCFWVFIMPCFWVNKRHDKTSQFHKCNTFLNSLFIYYFGYKINSSVRIKIKILCVIPRQWIMLSISPQMVVLAEMLGTEKADSYSYYVSIPGI